MREENPYSIQIIRDGEGLENIRERWDVLSDGQGRYGAFLCYDWFSIWLEHFQGRTELFVLTVSHGDEIVCIVPCLRGSQKMFGVPAWSIELMGNVYSPFRYVLLDRAWESQFHRLSRAIMAFFKHECSCWDVLAFRSVPQEEGWYDLLKKAVQDNGMAAWCYTDFGDWYLDNMDCSGEEYIAGLPKKIRKDAAYCRRRLEKTGKMEIKIVKDGIGLDAYIDNYYTVYGKSWQERESVGPNFHRDLAKMAARRGWLRLGFLFYNEESIAAQFWVTCQDTSYILKTVYDQEYRKFSPGKVLTVEMMRYAIDVDRVREIDYGQGDEAYKKDWTPKRRERRGLLVFNDSTRGRYLSLIHNQIRPAVKRSELLGRVVRGLRTLGGAGKTYFFGAD